MAICPDVLAEWIDRHGPYLYHRCGEPMRVWEIATVGLQPAGVAAPSRAWTNPAFAPRPGHVYLGTAELVVRLRRRNDEQLLAVDLRHLNCDLINPDEDAFWSEWGYESDEQCAFERFGLEDPYTTVRDHDNIQVANGAYTREEVDRRPYATYGQWAAAQNLGADPEHTRFALEGYGAVAVHGAISPDALSVVTLSYQHDRWTPVPAQPWPVARIWLAQHAAQPAAA